jgi:hypothetical protein
MLSVIDGPLRQRPRCMRRLFAAVSIAVFSLGAAGPAQAEPGGSPEAFFFSATCPGLGDVILSNIGPAQTNALHVVGSQVVLIGPFNGARGLEEEVADTTCDITGRGPSPTQIEPHEPFQVPVMIAGG